MARQDGRARYDRKRQRVYRRSPAVRAHLDPPKYSGPTTSQSWLTLRSCETSLKSLDQKGVRVNAICPGLVKTDFAKALWDNPEGEKRANEVTPMRRLGEPEDFKGIAVFLGSEASS